METPKFKLADIFYGIFIPLILFLLIFLLAIYVNPGGNKMIFGTSFIATTVSVILSQGFAQMIILGVPLVLGLLWNKWAGGAAGFITGGVYYLASGGYYNGAYAYLGTTVPYHNFYGDLSMLTWLVNGVIIGYMAGALNNGSTNFKRMLGAGLTASVITAFLQFYMNYNYSLDFAGGTGSIMKYTPRAMAHSAWQTSTGGYTAGTVLYGWTLAFVPGIALGIIVPVIAKVMTWYGLQPMRHQ